MKISKGTKYHDPTAIQMVIIVVDWGIVFFIFRESPNRRSARRFEKPSITITQSEKFNKE